MVTTLDNYSDQDYVTRGLLLDNVERACLGASPARRSLRSQVTNWLYTRNRGLPIVKAPPKISIEGFFARWGGDTDMFGMSG